MSVMKSIATTPKEFAGRQPWSYLKAFLRPHRGRSADAADDVETRRNPFGSEVAKGERSSLRLPLELERPFKVTRQDCSESIP